MQIILGIILKKKTISTKKKTISTKQILVQVKIFLKRYLQHMLTINKYILTWIVIRV